MTCGVVAIKIFAFCSPKIPWFEGLSAIIVVFRRREAEESPSADRGKSATGSWVNVASDPGISRTGIQPKAARAFIVRGKAPREASHFRESGLNPRFLSEAQRKASR